MWPFILVEALWAVECCVPMYLIDMVVPAIFLIKVTVTDLAEEGSGAAITKMHSLYPLCECEIIGRRLRAQMFHVYLSSHECNMSVITIYKHSYP